MLNKHEWISLTKVNPTPSDYYPKDKVETDKLKTNRSVFLTWITLITTNIYIVNYSLQNMSTFIISVIRYNYHAR